MSSPTEDTITTILANELEKRGVKVQTFPKVELPGIGLRKPDMWCHNGGDYVVEAKFRKDKLIEAVSKVYEYLNLPSVVGGFAILYPEELSRPGLSRESLENLVRSLDFTLVPVFRHQDQRRGFKLFEGTLLEVADFLAKHVLTPPVYIEPSVPDIIKTLRNAATNLATTMRHLTGNQLNDLFGGKGVFENILQYEERQYPVEDLRIAAAYILVTQLLFYHVLSRANPTLFQELDPMQVRHPSDLKHLYFDRVLNINYKAVLSYDVASRIGIEHIPVIKNVINAIKAIAPEKVRGDLLGTIFHDLIPFETRKSVAAYYTNVLAAEFLAWLAIDRPDAKVADFAVGSGGLLVAAYRRKRYLIEREREFTEHDHKRFVEWELTGIDIMPFAANVAACHLALQEPRYFTNRVRIAVWDSTDLKPGRSIPPIASLPVVLTGPSTLDSYVDVEDVVGVKGAVSLRDEKPDEIQLEECDAVIMNPPFTRQERIPERYKEILSARFGEYRNYLHGQLGYYGYFVLLADRFLKDEGRIAFVLPATVLKIRSCEGIRRLLSERYHVEYIVTTWHRSAFSESTMFREILLVARKTRPGPYSKTKIVVLKKLPETLEESRRIAEKIKASQSKLDDEEVSIRVIDYTGLRDEVDNWFKFIAVSDLSLLDVLNLLIQTGKLVPLNMLIPKDNIVRGVESSRGGWIQPLTITREERAKKRVDVWVLKRINGSYVEVVHRFLKGTLKIPKSALLPALRRVSLINKIDISSHTDYVIIDEFPDIKVFLEVSPRKFRYGRGFWSKWRDYVKDRAAHLTLVRRVDLSAPGTCLLAFYSQQQLVPPGLAWSLKIERENAKFLALWFNSTFHLLQLLIYRKETRGAFLQLDKYVLETLLVPDLRGLTEEKKNRLLQVFEEVRNVEFPSLLEQLDNAHVMRRKIDAVWLEVLGEDKPETLPTLYKALSREIHLLKRMMVEGADDEVNEEYDIRRNGLLKE
jgi:hypothetical protein